jgi:hypothetical protein
MNRLLLLDSQGAFPDKWDFMPGTLDPYYAWANSPRSVVRSSVIFWSLASIQAERPARLRAYYGSSSKTVPAATATAAPSVAETGVAAAPHSPEMWLRSPSPNPARGATWVTLDLGRATDVRLTIWDAAGRRVRSLMSGTTGAGERRVQWDGRDDAGRRAPAGVYLVRMEADGRVESARLVLLD